MRGASKGEGLGNQFLGHIRSVDAIVHVVRCFDDENVVHVSGSVDPVRDIEIIQTELALADLDTVEKRLARVESLMHTGDALPQVAPATKMPDVIYEMSRQKLGVTREVTAYPRPTVRCPRPRPRA